MLKEPHSKRGDQMSRLLLSALILSATFVPAQALVLTKCGPSKGKAYYLPGGMMQSGWQDDGIAKGGVQLVVDGASYDLFYTDAVGTRSATADGFQVSLIPAHSGRILVLAVNHHTGVVEHYLFHLDAVGRGIVVWGTIRPTEPFPKSSLMTADCDAP
jgi:hypothetical protein